MALANKDTLIYEIVINEPSVLTVLNRFDIILGVGDNTIESISRQKNIDLKLFLSILNTYINEQYFPENILQTISTPEIIDYFQKTNIYYSKFQIPNIERHFHSLISRGNSENGNLELMFGFFHEVKQELQNRIADDDMWFEEILNATKKVSINELPDIKSSDRFESTILLRTNSAI